MKLDEIPSEFIEPYLAKFFGIELQSIAAGYETPAQVKERLAAIDSFVTRFCGLHANIAMGNLISMVRRLTDEDFRKMAVEIIAECPEED